MTLLSLTGMATEHWGPIDLALDGGECVGISGPSGVGKTRLLRAIADLDPHQGEAVLDTQQSLAMPGPEWRRQVGYLPAEPAWWAATAREHFVPSGDELESVQLAADLLDKPVERLSSGERQRLALLRLLSVKPRVLLLDEPTANLDQDNTARVESLIQTYMRQHTAAVIWVSHTVEQLSRCCSRQLVMTHEGLVEP